MTRKYGIGKRIFSFLLMLVMLGTMIPVMTPKVSAAGEQWLWPVESVRIVNSNYGYRRIKKDNVWTDYDEHEGIDIPAGRGTPIRAAKSGIVVRHNNSLADAEKAYNGWNSFGNFVIIDHGDGTYSVYMHLCKNGVLTTGTKVKQGDTVGYAGDSGASQGYHLHFQICTDQSAIGKVNSTSLNPMPTNAEITVKNSRYELPSGWPTQKTTYIFQPNMTYKTKTVYPSHCTIKVTKDKTYVKTLPCSRESDANSDDIEIAAKGDTYEVVGLHANLWDNLWYQVISKKDGSLGFIFAGDATFVKQLIDDNDITFTDFNYPIDHKKNTVFVIKGKLHTKYQTFTKVTASVIDSSGKATNSSQNVNTTYYSLQGSAVDNNLPFKSFAAGKHNYRVSATVRSYYATASKTYTYTEQDVQKLDASFDIHEYTSKVTTAATCTTAGVKTFSCTACSKQYTESIAATGHAYNKVTTSATCTEDGITTATCSKCGDQYTEVTASATGHVYNKYITLEPSCSEEGLATYICNGCGDQYTQVLPTTEHTYGDWVVDGEQSCTEIELQYRTCIVCDHLDVMGKDALGHDYTCEIVKEPTPTATGLISGICNRCGEAVEVTLPAINDEDYTVQYGFYVWNDTTYGTFQFEVKVGDSDLSVSGVITSYLDEEAEITIQLLDSNDQVTYSTVVTGNSAAYAISGVEAGTYTMLVSKVNHVAKTCTIVLDAESIVQDISIYLLGDVTCDGQVTASDYSRLLAHVKKTNLITDESALSAADITGDGQVTASDYSRLLAHVKKTNPLW